MARLDGPIEVGDFDAFKRVAEKILFPSDSEDGTGDVTICLNSAGGSLAEAARIADYLEAKWIGTVVDDGDHCLSACSIIFMMGTQAYIESTGINRKLHINGTLGFHKPSFSLPDGGAHSSATVNKAFDIAIEATLRFVQLANRMQSLNDTPMIKSDLIEMMFSHSGQDFFYIDTVDKVGRWEIEVFGYDVPKSASEREALTACDNLSN